MVVNMFYALDESDYLDKYIQRLVNLSKYEEAIEYIDSLIPELCKQKNHKKKLGLLIKKGAILSMMGELFDALDTNKRASQIAIKLDCIKSQIKILTNIAIISDHFGDINSAVFQYGAALELALKHGYLKEEGVIKYNLGLVHYHIGNLKLATTYLNDSKEIAEKHGDFEGLILCQNVIGEIERKNGDSLKALEIHRNLLKKAKEHALTKRIYDIRRNIFLDSFAISKDLRIAYAMEKLLKEVETVEARSLYTQIAYDLAEILISHDQVEKAIHFLSIAEEQVKLKIRTFLSPSIYSLAASLYILHGKRYYKRAEKYCLYSLFWAESNSCFKEIVKVYILLGQIRLRTGNFKEAEIFFEKAREKLILIDDDQTKRYVIREYNSFINNYQSDSRLKKTHQEIGALVS
jgi:tetratricopeptide (TPR) repeat protein